MKDGDCRDEMEANGSFSMRNGLREWPRSLGQRCFLERELRLEAI
jgi:hypothetical protein